MSRASWFRKYNILAFYFLIVQGLVFARNQLLGEHILFFYYCDNIALFFAIGFFTKNIPLIKGLISSGFLLQVVYLIDLMSILLFNKEVTGTTIYLFGQTPFLLFVTLLMHFGTAFVALAFTFREKNNWTSLLYAFFYLCFLYFTTIWFTPKGYDMNCIFNACDVSVVYFHGFTNWWILIAFFFLALPTHLFQEFLYRLCMRYRTLENRPYSG